MLCSRRIHPWAEDFGPSAEPVEAPNELIDVAQLARRLGVARSTVYANSASFGAIRLGLGPRAPLRFDWTAVLAVLPTAGPRHALPPQHVRRPTHARAGNRLLKGRPRFPAKAFDSGAG